MAENFLSNDESIQGKWGSAPQLHAPDISGVLSAILKNRLGQQELTQKTISEAIKAEQARRQASAYADVLRNTGLSEGQDLSGMSAPQSTEIAQLLAQRTPDTIEDNYKKALTADANARAGSYGDGGGGSDGGFGSEDFDTRYPPTRTNEFGIQEYRKVTRGAHGQVIVNYQPYSTPIQPTGVQNQSQRQSYQTENDLQTALLIHQQRAQKEAEANTAKGAETKDPKYQNVPYSDSADWAVKKAELDKVRQQRMNPPPDDQSGRQQTTMPPQRFGSEQEARAAGHQSGDKIILFDPDTGRYRPYQIP